MMKKQETGDAPDKPGTERSSKLPKGDWKYLRISFLGDRRKSKKEISQDLAQYSDIQVHPSTVSRTLIFIVE